jgi:hypothetical protein
MNLVKHYVIDSSSLIELMRTNPIDIYVTVWRKIDELIHGGRLVSPEYVRDEIRRGDDDLKKWADRRRKMFKSPTSSQIERVTEVLAKFPGLAHSSKDTPDADPFLIALALEKKKMAIEDFGTATERIVISEERVRGNEHRIPLVCRHYGIRCIGIYEMFREEGWRF